MATKIIVSYPGHLPELRPMSRSFEQRYPFFIPQDCQDKPARQRTAPRLLLLTGED